MQWRVAETKYGVHDKVEWLLELRNVFSFTFLGMKKMRLVLPLFLSHKDILPQCPLENWDS